MVKVTVKWEKESYEVDVDLSQPAMVFKAQLFTLTGVPTDRQKIMGVKSAPLKDDADMSASGIKEGSKLMMLGRAEVLVAPEKPVEFLEDMPQNVQAAAAMKNFSPGLENLGNTCYMNSVLQCLYSVPELHDALAKCAVPDAGVLTMPLHQFTPAPGEQGAVDTRLTTALRDLFRQIKNSGDAVVPQQFHAALQQSNPTFQQRTREGILMQQDAEECWSSIVSILARKLHAPGPGDAAAGPALGAGGAEGAVMRQLFGIDFVTKLKCEQTGEERTIQETQYTFKCNISSAVSHLNDGFSLSCDMTRQQRSEVVGADVDFTGVSRITRLPQFLTVQLVRFFWKADISIKAKILKAVTFPTLLDVYEFCSDDLKKQLDVSRERRKKAEEQALGLKMQPDAKKAKQDNGAAAPSAEGSSAAAAPAAGADEAMPDAEPSTSGAGAAAAPAPEQTGFFELKAVLTHKGRSADSGHYVGWVKQKDGSWMQFDDDNSIPSTEDQILRLSGGGDFHMAYMLLYRAVLA